MKHYEGRKLFLLISSQKGSVHGFWRVAKRLRNYSVKEDCNQPHPANKGFLQEHVRNFTGLIVEISVELFGPSYRMLVIFVFHEKYCIHNICKQKSSQNSSKTDSMIF